MAAKESGPDDDSLDKFERKLMDEENKSSRQGWIRILLLVIVIGLGVFLYFNSRVPQEQAVVPPPAPKPAPKVETPPPPPVARIAPVPPPPAPVVEKPEVKHAEKGGVKYDIQLGTYKIEANALNMASRLEKAGYTPQLLKRNAKIGGFGIFGQHFRYREQADDESKKLSDKGINNAVILKGGGDYVIKFGSFTNAKEAETLLATLKEKGVEAQIDPKDMVMSPVTVVRVLGIADRADLEGLKDKLNEESISFIVRRSHNR